MSNKRLRTLLRRAAAACLAGCSAGAMAWIYPEHRDLALLAVQKVDPDRRAVFDRLWQRARSGDEARLCEAGADAAQGLAPSCIDWAAFTAIAGDHACSSRQMLETARSSPWILQVADVAAQLKADLARIPVTAIGGAHRQQGQRHRRRAPPPRQRDEPGRTGQCAAHRGHPAAAGRRRVRHPCRREQRALPARAPESRYQPQRLRGVDASGGL